MNENITEEQRKDYNAAQIGWGTRKVFERRSVEDCKYPVAVPLIRPQSFLSICGVEFDISSESLETIISEAIKLKLDVYTKGEHGLIKCPAALYEI